MKQTKQRKRPNNALLITCIILLILIAVPVLYYFGRPLIITAERAYRINWGIDLPCGMEMRYFAYVCSLGDSDQYIVFRFDLDDTGITENFSTGVLTQRISRLQLTLDILDIDPQYQLDLTRPYRWELLTQEDGSWLYILYDDTAGRLYLIQSLR